MKFSTLMVTALIAGLAGAPALAQQEPSKQPRLEYIFNQLDLDEQQREEVITLLKDHRQEHRSARRDRKQEWGGSEARSEGTRRDKESRESRSRGERPDRDTIQAMREQRQEHREQRQAELASSLNQVLAPDQVEHLMDYMAAHRPQHRQRNHYHRGEGRPDRSSN